MDDYNGNEFSLTFYGGEPLIKFDLMKYTIDYFIHNYPNVKKNFGFTTNLTLLDDDMIYYFSQLDDLEIVCSLDGPKIFHDKYRRYLNGTGSYDKSTANFKALLDGFYDPDNGRTLMINSVITPPYTKEKLNEINKYFRNVLKVPRDININYSYVDVGNMIFHYDNKNENNSYNSLDLSPLESWAAEDFEIKGINSEYFGLIDKELARVSNRLKSDDVIHGSYLHGNCLPGQRRLYVTTEGKFKTCEKVGNIPSLGDCFSGYNYNESYEIYINKYAKEYHNRCRDCWARTMCTICYENSLSTDTNNLYEPEGICDTSKRIIKDMFVNYFNLYEKCPESLTKALSQIEFR